MVCFLLSLCSIGLVVMGIMTFLMSAMKSRPEIIGKTVAFLLKSEEAELTICHRHTDPKMPRAHGYKLIDG